VPDRTGFSKFAAWLTGLVKHAASAVWAFISYDNLKDWLPRKWGRRFLIQVSTLSLVVGILSALTLHTLSRNLPTPSELKRIEQRLITRVYDSNQEILKEFYTQQRQPVTLNQVPRHLKEALLATEDRDFYEHWGMNLRRLAGAMIDNIRNLEIISGASTITQQLARNLFNESVGTEQSYVRKFREQLTAISLESNFSKDEILSMFLNEVYFANGAYGIQQAARNYFDKDVEALDLLESAFLVGILQGPYFYYNNPDRALTRGIRGTGGGGSGGALFRGVDPAGPGAEIRRRHPLQGRRHYPDHPRCGHPGPGGEAPARHARG